MRCFIFRPLSRSFFFYFVARCLSDLEISCIAAYDLTFPGDAGTLMSTSMFTTLHGEENKSANGWRITRYKFFVCLYFSPVNLFFVFF